MRIDVLGTPGCPHLGDTLARVKDAVARLARGAVVRERSIESLEEATLADFPGSPTIRVDGVDIEGPAAMPPALACRMYEVGGGPPEWLIEAALLRAAPPAHVLFLCVANSARSQMAEGVARSLAPSGVRISSAGSAPTRPRPEAVRALAEIGIDAAGQRSKGLEKIQGDVDVVITLCAEEVCPVWLAPARRVHWGFPDPAAIHGSEAQRMVAFRSVRDELVRRLRVLFGAAR